MTVSVVIPRVDTPGREAVHAYVDRWWRERFDEVVVSGDGSGGAETATFNRPAAINRAVKAASGSVLVISDADTVADVHIRRRVDSAYVGTVTFSDMYRRLDPRSTAAIVEGRMLPGQGTVEVQTAFSWSGVIVLPRDAYYAVGGMDERFVGWSPDDIAFAMAVTTMWPTTGRSGTVYHLHHDRDESQTYGRPGIADAMNLTERYKAAAGNRDAMGALLEEAVRHRMQS